MTDRLVKLRKYAKKEMKNIKALHAAYGLTMIHSSGVGVKFELAEDYTEIKYFFSDESFNKWSNDLLASYKAAGLEYPVIQAVHA